MLTAPCICGIWLQQPELAETPSLPQICQSRICILTRAPGASLRNSAVETISPPLYYTSGETATNPGFSLRNFPTIPHAEQMVWGECEPRCPVAQPVTLEARRAAGARDPHSDMKVRPRHPGFQSTLKFKGEESGTSVWMALSQLLVSMVSWLGRSTSCQPARGGARHLAVMRNVIRQREMGQDEKKGSQEAHLP